MSHYLVNMGCEVPEIKKSIFSGKSEKWQFFEKTGMN
jgi:hypothetical protein